MPVFDKVKKIHEKANLKGKAKRAALAARDDSDSSSDDESVNVAKSQKAAALQAKKELRKKLRSTKYDDWYALEGANEDDVVNDINNNLGLAAEDDASDVSSDEENATPATKADGTAAPLSRKQKKKAAIRAKIAADAAAAEAESAINAAAAEAAKEGETEESAGVQVNFSEPAMWAERMALVATKSLPSDLNPDDDPKREEVFIQHALLSVMRGITMLEKANIPWKRPADYYAEMYKSDTQMEKIRASIVDSKKKIQEIAHRRAMKDQKKFGKEVQAEVLRQRAKHKREMLDKVSEWRKKNKGNSGREDLDDVLDEKYGENPGGHYKGGGVRGAALVGDKKSRRNHFMQKKSITPGGGGKGARKAPNRPGKNRRNK